MAIRKIARRTGLFRNTVRKYVHSSVIEPRYPKRSGRRKLDEYEPTRVRERVMRRFKSMHQAQRFLSVHATIQNLQDLVNLGRHLVSATTYRYFRLRAFAFWNYAMA